MSEYEQLRHQTSALAKRNVLSHIALGLVAFAATCLLVNLTVSRYLWHPHLGTYSDTLAQISANAASIDTIFFGSSHFLWGIDPPEFDAEIANGGGSSTSHLFGTAGLSYPWTVQALKDLEKIDFANLRYVIVEPRLHVTTSRFRDKDDIFDNAFSANARFINNVGNIGEPLSMLTALDMPLEDKLQLYIKLGYGALISAGNLGVARDLFLPVTKPTGKTEVTWQNRGARSGPKTIMDREFQRPVDVAQGQREISAYERQALADMIARIEAMGATPLFLFPPSRRDTGLQQATRDALSTMVASGQIIDFTYTDNPAEIYRQQELWMDVDHLSGRGSKIFSAQLARLWADTFHIGAPDN
jgi:hypothetical protein